MKQIMKIAATAALAVGTLGFVATAASAAVVCNRDGDCWHVKRAYAYKPEFGIVVHPNNWRWGVGERYNWREHPGRGYWRNGVWVTF